MTTIHSRQNSFASSFVSTSANGLGISSRNSNTPNSRNSTTNNKPNHHPLQIGPWKLGRTLGKGSTGRVLLASNVNSGQKAAVKVVSKSILNNNENSSINSSSNSNSSDEIGRDSAGLSYGIEREIIIMKLLNHKNVLRLYDVWETDKALYLVLEYVEGGELFDLLVESGPLPEKTAIEFFKQIVLGASYCHNLGICHRDLKPENLLLDKDLNIKIADFGMAALESNDRLLETSCGSPHYAAPEIVRGLQYHGSASDVWSCGVILFALLTGRLPFDDENIRNLLLKVQKGDYEIVEEENISREAQDLISRMLTVDPYERIKTKDILSHPLIRKYPFTKQEQEDISNLPSPKSATRPVNSVEEIDKQILENLVILWHGKDKDSIVKSLLNNEPNPEKTFYSLLVRYRHEHSQTQGNNNRDSLVRSSSVISKVSSTSSGNNSTPRRRKSRNISASSSHKRPVSFQSIKSIANIENQPPQFVTPTKSNRQSLIISNNNTAPPLPKGVYDEVVQQKRGIKVSPEKVPSSNSLNGNTNKRSSMLFMNDSNATGTAPTNFNNNRNSVQLTRRLSNGSRLKRNSITSKVLSSYTKLQTMDTQKDQELKNYGKRTSADFGTLCDLLFNKDNDLLEEDEEEESGNGIKEDTNLDGPQKRKSGLPSLPSSSSFATLSRFIMDSSSNDNSNIKSRQASKRQSSSGLSKKRISVTKSKQRNSIISAKKRQSSFNDYFNSPSKSTFELEKSLPPSPVKSKTRRSTSNPIERISRILNANDLQNMNTIASATANSNQNTRSLSAFGTSTESESNPLGPPPKPISRLDPRYRAYDDYQKRISLDAARALALAQREEEQRQKEKEKSEIRRRKIEEAKIQAAKEAAAAAAAEEELARLKAEAEAEEAEDARIHADLKRKASQRVYGYDDDDEEEDEEEEDYADIYGDKTREEDDENTFIASSPSSVKRYTRASKPITLADVKIPQVTRRSRHFPGNSNRLSVLSIYSSGMANSTTNLSGLLKDGNNTSNNRASKNTRLSMLFEDDTVDMKFELPPQAGDNDENDNESLFFVTEKKNKSNRQSLLLAQSPALQAKPTLAPAPLKYKESKDTLISQNSNDDLYKAFKLPEIPGSPIKDDNNRKSLRAQQRMSSSKYDEPVDIFTESSVADLDAAIPSRPAPTAPRDGNIRASKINGKLEFGNAQSTNGGKPIASAATAIVPTAKERKPLGEIDKATQQRQDNKRKNSFFRKLSFGKQQQQQDGENERKTSITKAFLSLFQHDESDFESLELDTVLSQQDLFEALNSLFVSWKQHGIDKLQVQRDSFKMTANISKENALGLKQCKIGVNVLNVQKSIKGKQKSPKSRLVFSNLKGSSKSFKKLVGEIRNILDNENVLVA